jgi:hypothetical protein
MEAPRLSAEKKIRAAQARGEFDNLPGAGKPLKIQDLNDPDWFVKSLIRREQIDPEVLVHPTIALRREAESFPASLVELTSEAQVRAVLEDFNERVKAEWRRPMVGPSLPVVARRVPVEAMVDRWRELRAQLATEAAAQAVGAAEAAEAAADAASAAVAMPWWRRRGWRWRLRRRTRR